MTEAVMQAFPHYSSDFAGKDIKGDDIIVKYHLKGFEYIRIIYINLVLYLDSVQLKQ